MTTHSQIHFRDPHHHDSTLGEGDDWTAALQWANNDLVARHGGGEVILPPYQIKAGEVTYDSRISWRGHGPHSIVRCLDGAAGGFISRGFAALVGTNSTGGVFETSFRDMTIHGNTVADDEIAPGDPGGAGGGTGNGILHYGTSQFIDNVMIREWSQAGIFSEWASQNAYGVLGAAAGPPPATRVGRGLENRWSRMTLQDNAEINMHMNGPHDSLIHDVVAVQQYILAKIENNILIDAKAGGTQLSKVHTWGGDTDYGLNVSTGACRLTDIVCEGAAIAQLRIESSGGIELVGAHLFGQQQALTQTGLLLDGVGSASLRGMKFNRCGIAAIDFADDRGNNDIQAVITPHTATNATVVGTINDRTRYSWIADTSALAGQGAVRVNSLNQDLAFYGENPIPQQPTPATLADVIAWGQNLGLWQ